MGVYIKGMKMPKSCSDCLFFVDGLRDANDELCSACLAKEDNSPWGCGYKEIDGIDHMARRMDCCPLVEVPSAQPEIIRCKDCKWWSNDDYRECSSPNYDDGYVTPAGFYCGYAERRTE